MPPSYMNEVRYAHLPKSFRSREGDVGAEPEGDFERLLRALIVDGQTRLYHEEYLRALAAFREAMAKILSTIEPKMPTNPDLTGSMTLPESALVVDPLAEMARKRLAAIPAKPWEPKHGGDPALSDGVMNALQPFLDAGLNVTSFHATVGDDILAGLDAAGDENWQAAIASYQKALAATPESEAAIRGGIVHDLALLSEKAGQHERAQDYARQAVESFAGGSLVQAHAQAMATAVGIFTRAKAPAAEDFLQQFESLVATKNLNKLIGDGSMFGHAKVSPFSGHAQKAAAVPTDKQSFKLKVDAPQLMGLQHTSGGTQQKTLKVKGLTGPITFGLNPLAPDEDPATKFLRDLAATEDLELLSGWLKPVDFILYFPYLYGFVLPMSIGDCHAGLGNLEKAEDWYTKASTYKYINRKFEVVKVWTRLAQVRLERGDRAYRRAASDDLAAAVSFYESIVRGDKSLAQDSPLYARPLFAGIEVRVKTALRAENPAEEADNPELLSIVLEALCKLEQLATGLNFFGFAPGYVPPFGFAYLQTSARYFAQHASQVEQRYIQYKSQAENEEFRRQQLSQQAEVARQTVNLEYSNLREMDSGVAVAEASVEYAAVQSTNGREALEEFRRARGELLELTGIEVWANATTEDPDGQFTFSVDSPPYYRNFNAHKRDILNQVVRQRTKLTHDLEAARLQRALESAEEYGKLAEEQLKQANVRREVAKQRVKIAELQQRQAEENRDFLDMREFGSKLWFELARTARRLNHRYLDMATAVALLMESAYNAETERDLRTIRQDYQSAGSGGLMGADTLLADIDAFTLHHITATRARKNTVKRSVSLADAYPTQFQLLQTRGSCTFETRLEDFDRYHPGLYLAKIRNVEVVFIGLFGARSVAGTLRNIGASRFRTEEKDAEGKYVVVERVYPADVLVLSQFDIRQDALVFRFDPDALRLFENSGIETMWQLDLPLDANDFDHASILDVHVVFYYDGFFSRELEQHVRGTLPNKGEATRTVSMRLSAPDELFYLKNQHKAELVFDASLFPHNQKSRVFKNLKLKLCGRAETIGRVKLKLSTKRHPVIELITDAEGWVTDEAGSPLSSLKGQPADDDRWSLTIRAEDNPDIAPGGVLDLAGLTDLVVTFEYGFDYR